MDTSFFFFLDKEDTSSFVKVKTFLIMVKSTVYQQVKK